MSVPLVLIFVMPLAGAVLAPTFSEAPGQRRVVAAACGLAGLGAGIWALVRTIVGSGAAWRGFVLEPWHALLVCGALLCSAAAIGRSESAARPAIVQAGVFAATAAALMPLAVPGSHLLAVALPVSTIAFAVAAFAAAGEGTRSLLAARSVAGLAASDVLALLGIGTGIGAGSALPPVLSTTGAALLLAAAVVRLGLPPAARPAEEASAAGAGLGLLWNGAVRAQGFMLAVIAIGAGRGVAYAAAAVASLGIATAGIVGDREGGASVARLGTGVALLGFALGGAPATWGGVLAAGASFAAPAAWAAGRSWSASARATIAALPAGGLLAATALVFGAAFETAAVRPWFFALAVPAAAGMLASVARVWLARESNGSRAASRGGAGRGGEIAAAFSAAIALAAAAALAAVPVRASEWLAMPVAAVLGTGRLLSVGGETGIAPGLALVVFAAAIIALFAGPGRFGGGGPPGARALQTGGRGSRSASARAEGAARRWAFVAAVLVAAAIGLAIRVYVVAAGRGFL